MMGSGNIIAHGAHADLILKMITIKNILKILLTMKITYEDYYLLFPDAAIISYLN